MRRVSFASLFLTFVLTTSSSLSAADKDGWVNLFDGKTLTGWKQAEHGKAKYEVVD